MRGNYLESGALHPLALRESPADGTLAQAFGDVWELPLPLNNLNLYRPGQGS